MTLSNPVKLLWRIGVLLYGLSGGPPEGTEPTRANRPTAGSGVRQEERALELEAKRAQLELEVHQAELQLELKRLQLRVIELEQVQQQIDRARRQLDRQSQRQQQLAAALRREAGGARERQFARPIGTGKRWHVDSHGIIRDQSDFPVGVWGVDGDNDVDLDGDATQRFPCQ